MTVVGLPLQVWSHRILSYLDIPSLLVIGRTSRALREAVHGDGWHAERRTYRQQRQDEEGVRGIGWMLERFSEPQRWCLAQRVEKTLNSFRDNPHDRSLLPQLKCLELRTKDTSDPIVETLVTPTGSLVCWNKNDHHCGVATAIPSLPYETPRTSKVRIPLLKRTSSVGGAAALTQGFSVSDIRNPTAVSTHGESCTSLVADSHKTLWTLREVEGEGMRVSRFRARPGTGHTSAVLCLAATGKHIFSAGYDRTVKVWSRSSKSVAATLLTDPTSGGVLRLLPLDDQNLLSSSQMNKASPLLLLHDVSRPDAAPTVFTTPLPSGTVVSFQGFNVHRPLKTDDPRVFANYCFNSVYIFDVRGGTDPVGNIVMAPGTAVSSGCGAVDHCEKTVFFSGNSGNANGVSMSAASLRAGKVLWSTLRPHEASITSLSPVTSLPCPDFIPRVTHVFSASRDGTVRLWDASDPNKLGAVVTNLPFVGVHSVEWNGLHLLVRRSQNVHLLDFTRTTTAPRTIIA